MHLSSGTHIIRPVWASSFTILGRIGQMMCALKRGTLVLSKIENRASKHLVK